MWRYYIRIFDITKLKASNPIICGSFSAEVRFTKYNDNNNNTAVTFFWYHDMASLSFEAICVSSQRVGFHWKRRKCLSKSSCWRLLSRLGSDLKSASLSLSMSCSFSGCWPGRKRRGGGWGEWAQRRPRSLCTTRCKCGCEDGEDPSRPPAPSAFPQPAHLVPAAGQAAGRAPAPQWPRPGREAGGEAAGPAGRIFPQRPGRRRGRYHGDRGGQPSPWGSRAPGGAQPAAAAADARPSRPPNGPWEKPGANWEMGGRQRAGCLLRPPRHPQGLEAPAAGPGPERRRASSVRGLAAARRALGAISRFRLPAPPPAACPPPWPPWGGGRRPRRQEPWMLNGKSPQRRPSRHPSIPGGWSRQSRGPGAGLWRLVWCYFISVALWGDAVRKQWGARALRTSSPFLWMANACELARPGTRAAGLGQRSPPSALSRSDFGLLVPTGA